MRPSSFARFGVNSPRPAYEANASNINEDAIDCGIKVLGCCNTPRWRKLGTTKTFLSVLVLVAIVQGVSEKFIAISAHQAALEHDYDSDVVEWLLVTNGIVQGVFAILIAYWGSRIHKITWLCGMLIFQSVASIIVIIPTLTHNSPSESTITSHVIDLLCSTRKLDQLIDLFPHSITTLISLFLLQTGIAYGFIAFYTLGLIYLDDNAIEHNSPALIGAALAAKYLGYQFGNGLSLIVHELSFGWWFGWSIIAPILFILAIGIGLYPSRLPEAMIRQAADTIVETATNSSQISLSRTKFLSDISFFSSIKRIFRNKILMFNILATVFIETALVNYAIQEQNYLQSRFLLPDDSSNLLNNEWTSRTITKFVQPFVVALAVLIGALIIAKANPSARKIVSWNILTASIICLLFVAYIFIECTHNSIAGAFNHKLSIPFCSRNCICDSDIRFTPVCPENGVQTFYSPCHAGCSSDRMVNGQRVFGNCSCGIDSEISLADSGGVVATEGACGYSSCQKLWIIFQVLTGFGAVCIGSRLTGKVLISIRSVLAQDKAVALAMELTLVGIVAYVPGKIAYELIADYSCQFWAHDHSICYLHDSQQFGNFINIISAALSLTAVILEVIVFMFVKDLTLYGEDAASGAIDYRLPIEMQPISNDQADAAVVREAEPNQPLLGHLDTSAGVHTIQQSQPSYPTSPTTDQPATGPSQEVEIIEATVVASSSSQYFSPSPSFTKYSPVYKSPQSHVEELNFHLRKLNDRVQIELDPSKTITRPIFGSDINPSVGDTSDNDKESEFNICQLESSVSSLSGIPSGSSTVASPVTTQHDRNQVKNLHFKSIETDF